MESRNSNKMKMRHAYAVRRISDCNFITVMNLNISILPMTHEKLREIILPLFYGLHLEVLSSNFILSKTTNFSLFATHCLSFLFQTSIAERLQAHSKHRTSERRRINCGAGNSNIYLFMQFIIVNRGRLRSFLT